MKALAMRLSRCAEAGAALMLTACLWSCAGPEPITAPETDTRTVGGAVDAALIAELADAQDLRLERLAHVHRLGTASLTWTDEQGEPQREPQLEMSLFHRRPLDTAIELRKFGVGTIFWLGSDPARWWVFDLRPGMERRMTVGEHDGQGPDWLPPASVPLLIGLAPYPRDPARWRQLSDGRLAMRVDTRDHDLPVRAIIYLDAADRRPERVEMASVGGRHRLITTLGDYTFVNIGGVAPFDRPRIPHRITIVRDDNAFQLELRMDAPESSPPLERWDRLFALPGLQERFRPEEIEGSWPPQ